MVVYDWHQEKSEKIYVDVPFEKRIISKLIQENFIENRLISESLQSPILSAPFVMGDKGGISLSSFTGESKFADKITTTIDMMAPPEERLSKPPKREYNGYKFEYQDGIKFKLAERPFPSENKLASIFSNKFSNIKNQFQRRSKYDGEYSIFSTVIPQKGYGKTTVVKELLNNYMSNEVTLPYDLYKFKDREKGLQSLQKNIDSNLWVQVVYSHQFNPILSEKDSTLDQKYLKRLKRDFDVILTDIWPDDNERERIIKNHFMDKRNLLRTAQSFARSRETEELTEKDFEKARGLMIDNFDEFKRNNKVKNYFLFADTSSTNKRYSILQSYFIENRESKIEDIWDEVEEYEVFKEEEDLKGLLDWMEDKGHIIESGKGVYKWV